MTDLMIEGVGFTDLKQIPDDRGCVKHFYRDFGFPVKEVYITTVNYNKVKAWHGYHSKNLLYAVPKGLVKLVLHDRRSTSSTNGLFIEAYLGEANYQMVNIPPGVFNGFKGIAQPDSLVVVCADQVFKEEEIIRLPPNHFDGYNW